MEEACLNFMRHLFSELIDRPLMTDHAKVVVRSAIAAAVCETKDNRWSEIYVKVTREREAKGKRY